GGPRSARQKRNDGHERQRGMESAAPQREPRYRSGHADVRPEAADARPSQRIRDRQSRSKQNRELAGPEASCGIENRQHDQPERIVGDREKQKKRDRQMASAKNQSRGEIAE